MRISDTHIEHRGIATDVLDLCVLWMSADDAERTLDHMAMVTSRHLFAIDENAIESERGDGVSLRHSLLDWLAAIAGTETAFGRARSPERACESQRNTLETLDERFVGAGDRLPRGEPALARCLAQP